MDERGEWLTYREAAKRVRRSVRMIHYWRRDGMPMEWAVRDGQRVRIVHRTVLMAEFRRRLGANPVHQQRLRARLRDTPTRDTEC